MIDFATVITDIEGQPMKQDGSELTLRSMSITALTMPFPDEQNLSGEEKVKRALRT